MLGFKIHVREERKQGNHIVFQFAMVFAVLMAIFSTVLSVVGVELEQHQVVITVGITAFLPCLFLRSHKHFWKKILVSALILMICSAALYKNLYRGVLIYLAPYMKQYNQFYKTANPIIIVETDVFSMITVLFLLSAICGFILMIAMKTQKGLFAATLLLLCPVFLAAYVGKMPDTMNCLALLASGCFYAGLFYENGRRIPIRKMAWISALLALVIAVSAMGEPMITNYKKENMEAYQEMKQKLIVQQRELLSDLGDMSQGNMSGSIGGGISEGNVSNLKKFNPTGKKVMEIVLDKAPLKDIYLKAFTGVHYTGKRWEEVSNFALSGVIPVIGGSEEKRSLMNESFRRIQEADNAYISPHHIEIRLTGAPKTYGYAPYQAQITEEHDVYQDSHVKGNWSNQREYDFYMNSYFKLAEPSELWTEYEALAKELYVADYDNLKYMKKLIKEIEKTEKAWAKEIEVYENVTEAFHFSMTNSFLQSLFLSSASEYKYSRDPGEMPRDMDFVEGFLSEKKEGFCVHYATAATLLFQMRGQPARYVEGYVVRQGEFKRMSDGTFRAIVTDANAHAWCEVFEPHYEQLYVGDFNPAAYAEEWYGWVVRDYTPADDGDSADETQKAPENVTPQENKDTPKEDEPQKQPQENQTQEPENPKENGDTNLSLNDDSSKEPGRSDDEKEDLKWEKLLKKIIVIGGTTITVILFVWFLIGLQRRIRRKKKREHFLQKDRKKGVLGIYKEMYELCLFTGFVVSGKSEKEQMETVIEKIPQISEEEWNWIYDMAEKAAFSRKDFSKEEQKTMYSHYRKLRKEVLKELGFWKKIWFVYGRAM